jgi:Domain of unknown function (DUF4326)
MTAPIRIQRQRAKGWRMPPNTVSVTRPGKWGNPFDFRASDCCWLALSYGCRGDRRGRQEASVKAFRDWITPQARGRKLVRMERGVLIGNDEKSFQIGPRFIVGPPPTIDSVRTELRGKNLACFCAIDQPCHADVLLELANTSQESKLPLAHRKTRAENAGAP